MEASGKVDIIPEAIFLSKAEKVLKVLKLLHIIIEKMGAEKTTTLSSLYPVLINLLSNTMLPKGEDEFEDLIRQTILEGLNKRYGAIPHKLQLM